MVGAIGKAIENLRFERLKAKARKQHRTKPIEKGVRNE
jgi:hypothetical protein